MSNSDRRTPEEEKANSSQSASPTLPDRVSHLAQVFLDGELEGTPLNGSNVSLTVSYMKEFITWISQEQADAFDRLITELAKRAFADEDPAQLQTLLNSLSEIETIYRSMVTTARHINDAAYKPEMKNSLMQDHLKQLAQASVKKLREEGQAFTPGGWVSQSGGHQTIYRLQLKEGQILFYEYNTGDGIQYHETETLASGKTGHCPIWGMKFPENTKNQYLVNFIAALLAAQIMPQLDPANPAFEAKDIHEKILPAFFIIFRASLIPKAELPDPIHGQQDGTCVFKVTKQVVRSHFKAKANYNLYFLAYRLYLLRQELTLENMPYLENHVPGYRKLLSRSLENTVRMLSKEAAIQWNLTQPENSLIKAKFLLWKKSLKEAPKQRVGRVLAGEANPKRIPSTIFQQGSYDLEHAIENQKTLDRAIKLSEAQFPQGLSFLEALTELDKYLKEYKDYGTLDRSWALFENFCFVFSDPALKLITEDKLANAQNRQKIFEKLKALSTFYQTNHPTPTPRSVPLCLALVYFLDRLCKEGLFDVSDTVSLGCFHLYGKEMAASFARCRSNPYLATEDPKLDLLWERMIQFYRKNISQAKTEIAFYSELINKAKPNEQELIRIKWRQDAANPRLEKKVNTYPDFNEPNTHHFAYLWRLNQKELPTPVLNSWIKQQMDLESFVAFCLAQVCVEGQQKMPIAAKYFHIEYKEFENFGRQYEQLDIQEVWPHHFANWYLQPNLLSKNFRLEDPLSNHPLTSGFDSNSFSSDEIAFHKHQTSFKEKEVWHRYRSEAYSPLLSLSAQDLLASKLHHLRISPNSQAALILSELVYCSTWLSNKGRQEYIRASQFQPGVLLTALRLHPATLFELLQQLLQQNRYTQDPAYPEAAEWFMLKLAADLGSYLLETNGLVNLNLKEEQRQSAAAWQKEALKAVDERLSNPQQSFLELQSLYSLKLKLILPQENLDETYFDRLIHCYLTLALLPKENHASYLIEEERIQALLEKTYTQLMACLQNGSLSEEQFTKSIAKHLKTIEKEPGVSYTMEKMQVESAKFPSVVFKDNKGKHLSVNLALRQILYNNKLFLWLPPDFILTPEFQAESGTQPLRVFKSLLRQNVGHYTDEYDCYSFSHEQQEYRIVQNKASQKSAKTLQKKIGEHWYTLAALTKPRAYELQFEHFAFNALHPLLDQGHFLVWFNKQEQSFQIVDRDTKQIYYRQDKLGLHKEGELAGLILPTTQIPPLLLRLEAPQFIEVIKLKNERICYHLPRYGLTVLANEKGEYHTLAGDYKLEIPAKDLFGTGLSFRASNCDQPDLYRIPLQPYYLSTDQPYGCHYLWSHDLSAYLSNDYFTAVERADLPRRLGWDHRNSENLVSFILKGERLEAQTPADAYYLAYLYLAQDRPKQAYKCLEENPYQGTAAELQQLWWLIEKLPAPTEQVKLKLLNSRLIAIQMKALHMLMNIQKAFPGLLLEGEELKQNTVTGLYKLAEREKLKAFLKDLPTRIFLPLYQAYDDRSNNIPKSLRLKAAEEPALLSHAQAHNSGPYLQRAGTRYLEYFSQDKTQEERVSLYPFTVAQDFTRPVDASTWVKRLHALSAADRNLKFDLPAYSFTQAEVEGFLDLNLSVEHFIERFPVFYALCRKLKSEGEREELKRFVKALAQRWHNSPYNRNSCYVIAAEILWVVLHTAPETFPEKITLEYKTDSKTYKGYWEAQPVAPGGQTEIYSKSLVQNNVWRQKMEDPLPLQHLLLWMTPEILAAVPPMQLQGFTVEGRPHTVTLERSLQSAKLDLTDNTRQVDPLKTIALLNDLREKLLTREAAYEKARADIFKQLAKIPDLPLDEQNKLFLSLDKAILALVKEKYKEQYQLYVDHAKAFTEKCLQDLAKAKADLAKNKSSTCEAIDKQLSERKANTIAELGKQLEKPTRSSLLRAYAKLTPEYLSSLGIEKANQAALEESLGHYLALEDAELRLNNLSSALKMDKQQSSPESQQQVVSTLLSKNRARLKHEALLQHLKKLALRPEQEEMLAQLYENAKLEEMVSYMLQMIMGGGKTKVILPLLIYLLAECGYLPCVLFPPMSLHTGFCDLRATSALLQQSCFLFRFNRHSDCSVKKLQENYEAFTLAHQAKEYLVAAPYSESALELKYVEILFQRKYKQVDLAESAKQLHWLGKILGFLRKKVINVGDEGHLTYSIRRELNHAIGTSKNVEPRTVNTIVNLVSFLDTVARPAGENFEELLYNPTSVPDEDSMRKILEGYIPALTEAKAPEWAQDLLVGNLSKEQLVKFLSTKTNEEEDETILKTLTQYPAAHERWLLLQAVFSELLPMTLTKKLRERYGPPKTKKNANGAIEEVKAEQKEEEKAEVEAKDWSVDDFFAVPYQANNNPTNCVFGFFLEPLMFTTLMIRAEGIPFKDFKNLLLAWQNEARLARSRDNETLSTAEKKFNAIINKGSLLTLDTNDYPLMKALHNAHKHNKEFVVQILLMKLPQLKIDPKIIRSNPLNLAKMPYKNFLFSATPGMYRSLDRKTRMAMNTRLLVDSKVEDLLKEKNTAITTLVGLNHEDYLRKCLNSNPRVRALIDCGSHLLGLANLEAAELLAKICREEKKPIYYILFYQEDALYALNVKDKSVKKLSSTDAAVIQNELGGCPPQGRFTYYDQEHTLGSDIKQFEGCGLYLLDQPIEDDRLDLKALQELVKANNDTPILIRQGANLYLYGWDGEWKLTAFTKDEAQILAEFKTLAEGLIQTKHPLLNQERIAVLLKGHSQFEPAMAVLTVDSKTEISPYQQAALRLRGFELKGQELIIALDQNLAKFHPHASLDELHTRFRHNEDSRLKEEHFIMALKDIQNLFRNELMKLLLTTSAEMNDRIFDLAEDFFVEAQETSIVALYGQRSKLMKIADIIPPYAERLFSHWKAIMIEMSALDEKIVTELAEEIKEICDLAEKHCEQEHLFQAPKEPEQNPEPKSPRRLPQQGRQFAFGREVQQQKEQRKENKKEINKEQQQLVMVDPRKQVLKQFDFSWIVALNKEGISEALWEAQHSSLLSLHRQYNLSWAFDAEIYASNNYLWSFRDAVDRQNPYTVNTKPAFALLFSTAFADKLRVTLICGEELELLAPLLAEKQLANYWLATLSNHNLSRAPLLDEATQTKQQRLLEQATYFNGRADILSTKAQYHWLNTHTFEKIEFLSEQIRPFVALNDAQLIQLKNCLFLFDHHLYTWLQQSIRKVGSIEPIIEAAPRFLRKRLREVMLYLWDVGQKMTVDTKAFELSELNESHANVELSDRILMVEFANLLNFLYRLQSKAYAKAADFFIKQKFTLPKQILSFWGVTEPLAFTLDTSLQMLEALTEEASEEKGEEEQRRGEVEKLAWLKQFVGLANQQLSYDQIGEHLACFINPSADCQNQIQALLLNSIKHRSLVWQSQAPQTEGLVKTLRALLSAKDRLRDEQEKILAYFVENNLIKEDNIVRYITQLHNIFPAMAVIKRSELIQEIHAEFVERATTLGQFSRIVSALDTISDELRYKLLGLSQYEQPHILSLMGYLNRKKIAKPAFVERAINHSHKVETAVSLLEKEEFTEEKLISLLLTDSNFAYIINHLSAQGLVKEFYEQLLSLADKPAKIANLSLLLAYLHEVESLDKKVAKAIFQQVVVDPSDYGLTGLLCSLQVIPIKNAAVLKATCCNRDFRILMQAVLQHHLLPPTQAESKQQEQEEKNEPCRFFGNSLAQKKQRADALLQELEALSAEPKRIIEATAILNYLQNDNYELLYTQNPGKTRPDPKILAADLQEIKTKEGKQAILKLRTSDMEKARKVESFIAGGYLSKQARDSLFEPPQGIKVEQHLATHKNAILKLACDLEIIHPLNTARNLRGLLQNPFAIEDCTKLLQFKTKHSTEENSRKHGKAYTNSVDNFCRLAIQVLINPDRSPEPALQKELKKLARQEFKQKHHYPKLLLDAFLCLSLLGIVAAGLIRKFALKKSSIFISQEKTTRQKTMEQLLFVKRPIHHRPRER